MNSGSLNTSMPPRNISQLRQPPNKRAGLGTLATIGLGLCMMVWPPTFVVLLVGMAPSWVTLFVDGETGRRRSWSMLALNGAGVIPTLSRLWHGDNSIPGAVQSLTNIFSWGVMYGAAAVSFMLLWLTPQIAAIVLHLRSQRFKSAILKRREKLLAEWGNALLQPPAPGKGLREEARAEQNRHKISPHRVDRI